MDLVTLKACKYSVVRYMPDHIIGEVFNVGVILHSTEPYYLKFIYNTNRIKKLYKKNVDLFDLNFTAKYLENLCEKSSTEKMEPQTGVSFQDANFLDSLSQLFNDSIMLTFPRTTLAEDFDIELQNLLHEYVQTNDQPKPRFTTKVFEKFKQAGLEDKIKKFIEMDVEVVERVQFGYQNGLANLMQPIPLTGAIQANLEKAAYWNIAVHEIREKSQRFKNSPFYAIVTPSREPQKDGFDTALAILSQNFSDEVRDLLKIVNFETREMDGLLEKIKAEAH